MKKSILMFFISLSFCFSQGQITDTIFHRVKKNETLYSISNQYSVDISDIISLNPDLKDNRLKRRSRIMIPVFSEVISADIVISDSLNINTEINEILDLKTMVLESKNLNNNLTLSLLLPFNTSSIELDSIDKVEQLFKTRNLYTISLDFYSGVLYALNELQKTGVNVKLDVYDTENSFLKIESIVKDVAANKSDAIIGPIIPDNFDFISKLEVISKIPRVFPLSTNPVNMLSGVIQAVTPKRFLRNKMIEYLKNNLSPEDNIVIVADSLNRDIEGDLKNIFPNSITLRPESEGGYILPELVDSLLVDSLPNKVIVETEIFTFISSIISQMNSQISNERKVQLFTTYRGNIYDDSNINIKDLGNLNFTYSSMTKPTTIDTLNSFTSGYIDLFGNFPNKDVVKAFDITTDILLRLALHKKLDKSFKYGDQKYIQNRYNYVKDSLGGYINNGFYILRHSEYNIDEIIN
ncbi:MAG: LysM peptidoglycan-binding domain-containing protein [Flavobacteriales bacterium]|nr:MAG: LysM peptidoglycan-binding domain-containing protein [Flavobacteriales bacterium]|tara:strand:+ start:2051 stop:3448 length:1398 start_codon:yes stop_codon:yes gene_type:complete